MHKAGRDFGDNRRINQVEDSKKTPLTWVFSVLGQDVKLPQLKNLSELKERMKSVSRIGSSIKRVLHIKKYLKEEKMQKYILVLGILVLPLILRSPVLAQGCCASHSSGSGGHSEHSQHQHVSSEQALQSPVQQISVEGYTLTFGLQDKDELVRLLEAEDPEAAQAEIGMQGKKVTHHLSLLIEDQETSQKLNTLPVEIKIINPKGKKESKMNMWMGNHYCNYFNFKEKGDYTILATFTVDGKKHSAGFEYEIN